jgi:hypothetical protein
MIIFGGENIEAISCMVIEFINQFAQKKKKQEVWF